MTNLIPTLRRNVVFFQEIVARAEANNSMVLDTFQGCLRAAEKRLERALEESQDSE